MEAAGLGFSVVAVTGTITACFDIWLLISTGRRVSDDLDSFLRQIHLQSYKFFTWCESTGLWDRAVDVQSREPAARTRVRGLRLWDVEKSRAVYRASLPGIVDDNIKAMLENLEKAHALLVKYGACESRQRRRLQKRNPAAEVMRASQKFDSAPDEERKSGFWDKVGWAATGRRRSEDLLAELKSATDALFDLVTLIDKPLASELSRLVEIGATNPAMSRAVVEAAAPGPSDTPSGGQDAVLLSLSQLSQRERESQELGAIDEGEEVSWEAATSTPTGVSTSSDGDWQLSRDDLKIDDDAGETLLRQTALFHGQTVMVEWRYYSTRLSPEGRDLLQHRIHLLVLQLRQASSTAGFRVAPCLGAFYVEPEARYGLVFGVPPGGVAAPQTLYECLASDYSAGVRRDLEARLHLARQLVVSVFRFLSIGWLHKNVRSSSVLFLDPQPADPLALPRDAYLAGFGLARAESATALTELNPSALRRTQESREWRLYCHPERDVAGASPCGTSTARHDAYGLGIVLLEIALWGPVTKISSRKQSVEEFHAGVVDERMDDVRFHMGGGYSRVVRRLLEGDFDEDPVQGLSTEEKRLTFLDAFQRTIVAEMESLFES